MSNAVVSNIGQIAGSGDTKALFLKVYGGEVITAFETANSTIDKHMVRTISTGKSAQFPVMGKASASYHTAGNEITGGSITHNERVINIQGLLIAPLFVSELDELMSHYDVRSQYAKEQGAVLANTFDKHIYQTIVNASRAGAASPQVAGQQVTDADFVSNGTSAAESIFKIARYMDEQDVPENDRYVAVTPEAYYNLVQTTNVINRDWGGNGVYAEGTVLKVAGINIIKTNNLPNGANITSGVLDGSDGTLGGDYTNTVAVGWHKSAVGSVKLMDLSVQAEFDIRRQGTLMVAKYAMGHGILNPISAIEVKSA
jgi:hypothetical protein